MRKILEQRLDNARNDYHNCYGDIDNFPFYEAHVLQGQIEAYQDCLNLLNQYNIITAPKEIKLSEILNRLNKEHKAIINGNVIYEYKVHRNGLCNADGTLYHISDISINSYHYGKELVTAIRFTPKMTITEIDFGEKYKWLYELWIAGTKIIDDLKGEL